GCMSFSWISIDQGLAAVCIRGEEPNASQVRGTATTLVLPLGRLLGMARWRVADRGNCPCACCTATPPRAARRVAADDDAMTGPNDDWRSREDSNFRPTV